MRYGYGIATRPPLATPETVARLAAEAEACGFSALSVADHILPPYDARDPYPYTVGGAPPWDRSGAVLEQIAYMAFLTGLSKTLRVITGVMVVPLRNPAVTAKMIATIDYLSNGRVTVGCGVGWESAEFAATGAAPFAARGRVTDEYIRLWKELWTAERPAFKGEFVSFADLPFAPKPVQKPHPPIWIGGEGDAALSRTVRLGDGWYPINSNGRDPLNTPERYGAANKRLDDLARAAGRDPAAIDRALIVFDYDERAAENIETGARKAFTGTHIQIADDIQRYRDHGLEHLTLRIPGRTVDEIAGHMERFADRVASRVR